MDYLDVIRKESARFAQLTGRIDPAARVPACPDWTGADLVHHLAEVQDFWSQVARGADGDSAEALPRPEDDAQLPQLYAAASSRLVDALAGADPAAACWSWHDEGHSIGWVLRRQAHEALIHRVDAEQTAGVAVTAPDPELAADGVDEMLTVMVDGFPAWGTFMPDGDTVRIATGAPASTARQWTLALGRFTGVGPQTGRSWDLPVAQLVPADGEPSATVTGSAWDLDLWLWGRGPAPQGADASPEQAAVIERLRGTLAEAGE